MVCSNVPPLADVPTVVGEQGRAATRRFRRPRRGEGQATKLVYAGRRRALAWLWPSDPDPRWSLRAALPPPIACGAHPSRRARSLRFLTPLRVCCGSHVVGNWSALAYLRLLCVCAQQRGWLSVAHLIARASTRQRMRGPSRRGFASDRRRVNAREDNTNACCAVGRRWRARSKGLASEGVSSCRNAFVWTAGWSIGMHGAHKLARREGVDSRCGGFRRTVARAALYHELGYIVHETSPRLWGRGDCRHGWRSESISWMMLRLASWRPHSYLTHHFCLSITRQSPYRTIVAILVRIHDSCVAIVIVSTPRNVLGTPLNATSRPHSWQAWNWMR